MPQIFGRKVSDYHTENQNWMMNQLVRLVDDTDISIDMNPPYQRGLVWDLEHKVKLIDSFVTRIGCPPVYLRMREPLRMKKGEYVYEIVDGKQRINTLWEFMHDEFEYNGKVFSEHHVNDQKMFKTFPIGVVIVRDISDEDVIELYNRINYGGVPHE